MRRKIKKLVHQPTNSLIFFQVESSTLIQWMDGGKNFTDPSSKSCWTQERYHSWCFSDDCRDDSHTFGMTKRQFLEELGLTEEEYDQQIRSGQADGI